MTADEVETQKSWRAARNRATRLSVTIPSALAPDDPIR
jgi:hypothetical protein